MKNKRLLFGLLFLCTYSIFASSVKADTITLENNYLQVKISTLGAEMISIYNKEVHFEHLWQGEKASWNQHAPILFPVVGKLKNKQYTFEGETYQMKNHGFASSSPFQVLKKSKLKVVLQLSSDKNTLKKYPFQFLLTATYQLKGKKIIICYEVKNQDQKEMYFSIGAHPGFNIPIEKSEKYNDYYLEFSTSENATRLPLTKKGSLSHQEIKGFVKGKKIPLSHQLFKDRVVILEGLKSDYVTIRSNQSKMGVKIKIKNFDFVGIWTSHKKNAPFICIEPWYGITDYVDTDGNIKTKKAIKKLAPRKKFMMKYDIEIVKNKK